jgi:hypothetical protein
MIRGELDNLLARPRYGRGRISSDQESVVVTGHRRGTRKRCLTGTFGPIEIAVPRARLNTADGKTTERKSKALRAYQRTGVRRGRYWLPIHTKSICRSLIPHFDLDHSPQKDALGGPIKRRSPAHRGQRGDPWQRQPQNGAACSTHFTFQAASHSTFAIAGVASLSLAHGGRGERRKIGLSLETRG